MKISFKVFSLLFIVTLSPIYSNDIDVLNKRKILQAPFNNYEKAQEHISLAEININNGNLNEAKENYLSALQYNSNPETYYNLGSLLFDLNDFKNSIKAFTISGDLGYNRPDYAYYNAACAASLSKSTYETLYNFELALMNGYNHWNYLMKDKDIEYLRNQDGFNDLINRYNLPEYIANPQIDLKHINNSKISSLHVDFDGDNTEELLILMKFRSSYAYEMGGNYYFALYNKTGENWKFQNISKSNTISIPRNLDTNNIIIQNLNEIPGNEILINSTGRTYKSSKILSVLNSKLHEIGEVEGFESIKQFNNKKIMIGRNITDFSYGSNDSEIYKQYYLDYITLVQTDLSETFVNDLYNKKKNYYFDSPKITTASSYYWFTYNYQKNNIDNQWITEFTKTSDFDYKSELLKIINENK